MKAMLRAMLAATMLGLLLAACGGGGTAAVTAPAAAAPDYAKLAATAQITASVNLGSNTVQISWLDVFPSGSTYSIQSVGSDGTVLTLATQAASGTNNALAWSQVVASSKTYAMSATNAQGQNYQLATATGSQTLVVTIPSSPPLLSVAANLTGTTLLTLDKSFAYPSVSWFCDTALIGTGTGLGNNLSWNTATATNGQHLLIAVITLSDSSTVSLRQQVNVSNSNLVVNASASGTTGSIAVNVTASSNFPITTVSATLDSNSLGLLTAPNACSKFCSGTNNIYQFNINSVSAGSGSHSVVATATDSSGASQTTTIALPISNPPILLLSSPVDGGFINGVLNISGSMSSDKAGAVTVTAFLGSLPITLTQSAAAFSGAFSLAGLPAGPYTLTVNAKDSTAVTTTLQTSIIVASSAALTYTSKFSMGAGGQLIAVDNSNPALLLYLANDGSYRIRDSSVTTDVVLQGAAAIPFRYNWTMDGGYVYMEGGYLGSTMPGYTDCPLDCIYQWSPAGVKTNLSNANPFAPSSNVGGGRAYEQYPKAHGGYVIWIDAAGANPGTYTLYNVAQASYSVINQPAGANYLGNTSVDFAVVNNVVNFFYWANTGTSSYDVYQWNSATRASVKLSGGATRSIYPQTDGQRVAWSQAPTSTTVGGPASLVAQALSGGAPTVLSTGMINFTLAGGVLAWIEGTASVNAQGIATTTITGLKASTIDGSVVTITPSSSATLYGVGGGHVVYGLLGKLYDWNSTTAVSSLLVDTVPALVMVSANTMYFTLGSSQAVYQITLH
jgi:hypothetical protein